MWPFNSLTTDFLFCQQNFVRLKNDSTRLIDYFFSLVRLAPYDIFVLRFTSRMWNWVRCGSLLIDVVVDNQTEKLKTTRTTHLNRDIDIYVEECKLKKISAKCWLFVSVGLSALTSVRVGYATRLIILIYSHLEQWFVNLKSSRTIWWRCTDIFYWNFNNCR